MRLLLCCFVAFARSACSSPEGCPEATTCRAAQNRLADAVESHRLPEGGFEIECTYTGPGFNRCTLDEKRRCSGYSSSREVDVVRRPA